MIKGERSVNAKCHPLANGSEGIMLHMRASQARLSDGTRQGQNSDSLQKPVLWKSRLDKAMTFNEQWG